MMPVLQQMQFPSARGRNGQACCTLLLPLPTTRIRGYTEDELLSTLGSCSLPCCCFWFLVSPPCCVAFIPRAVSTIVSAPETDKRRGAPKEKGRGGNAAHARGGGSKKAAVTLSNVTRVGKVTPEKAGFHHVGCSFIDPITGARCADINDWDQRAVKDLRPSVSLLQNAGQTPEWSQQLVQRETLQDYGPRCHPHERTR